MLITSKIKDFYDSAAVYGIDKKLVFNRHQTRLELKRYIFPDSFRYGWKGKAFSTIQELTHESICKKAIELGFPPEALERDAVEFKIRYLGFCGKIYFITEVIDRRFKTDGNVSVTIFDEISLSQLKEFVRQSRSYNYWFGTNESNYMNKLDEIFNVNFYQENSAAYFILNRSMISIHPSLKELGFGKIMSAPEIFQEISMFLGEQITNVRDTIETDDQILLQNHGYDKMSFRKEGPPTRKKNQKRFKNK